MEGCACGLGILRWNQWRDRREQAGKGGQPPPYLSPYGEELLQRERTSDAHMWLVGWFVSQLVGKELSVELDYNHAHTHTHTPSRFSRRGGHVESW